MLYIPPIILNNINFHYYMYIAIKIVENIKKSKYNGTPGPLKLNSLIEAVKGNSIKTVGNPQQGQELLSSTSIVGSAIANLVAN